MLCLVPREVHTDVNGTSERRRGFRLHQTRPVRVFDAENGCFVAGETRDVSAAGLRICLPIASAVQVGSTVNIAIGKSGAINRRGGLLAARVVWTHLSFETGLTAGIEFIPSTGTLAQAA